MSQCISVYSNTPAQTPRISRFHCTEISKLFMLQTSIAFAEFRSIYI